MMPTIPPKTVAELLSGPEKWTKGIYHKIGETGNVICCCLAGAVKICYVGQVDDVLCKLAAMLPGTKYVVSSGYEAEQIITRWNDAPERTFEDVKALVEKAGI